MLIVKHDHLKATERYCPQVGSVETNSPEVQPGAIKLSQAWTVGGRDRLSEGRVKDGKTCCTVAFVNGTH